MNDSQAQIEMNFSPAPEKFFRKNVPFKSVFIKFAHTPNLSPIKKKGLIFERLENQSIFTLSTDGWSNIWETKITEVCVVLKIMIYNSKSKGEN